ncbi:MAG: hypothetical protein JXQ27_10080 [Acidobacteria bacterium]|nr:hypothetical protein [Acidobacteriota bacterium]
MNVKVFYILCLFPFFWLLGGSALPAEDDESGYVSFGETRYPLYPRTLDQRPDIPSPLTGTDSQEFLLIGLKDGTWALIPVTMENGKPLLYSYRVPSVMGKDQQLRVDEGDFPTLARTGLHAEAELDGRERITGFPVSVITYIGRPDRFSYAGFMAADEDIISVLKGDNRLVARLGLTHPDLARPLFHVWNIILHEYALGRWGRFLSHIPYCIYNGNRVGLHAEAMKGWQVSIFQDEIRGRHDISVERELTGEEKAFLRKQYAHLSAAQVAELERKLSRIGFSEMLPYYIMRYGFYEGHTDYRADPLAIAFVFGLKNLAELEAAFPGKLYETLTTHHTAQ